MTALVRRGFDMALDFIGAAAWSLVAFVVVANLVSPAVGGVFALALFVSLTAMTLNAQLQESRMAALTSGVCPRCQGTIASEHRHRRWDAARDEWLTPHTSWDCAACDYMHGESWPCAACPTP
jgi:phosphate/sulfate permease